MSDFSEYQKSKFVAFVDLLGFANHIYSIKYEVDYENVLDLIKWAFFDISLSDEYNEIADTLIKNIKNQETIDYFNNFKVKATFISDSIILSSSNLHGLIVALCRIQRNLLCKYKVFIKDEHQKQPLNFLLRGAISRGRVFHDDKNNIIFGDAYQNAYYLESKHVVFPRIIVDKSIMDSLDVLNNLPKYVLQQSKDGLWSLNYLILFKLYNSQMAIDNTKEFISWALKEHKHKSFVKYYEWLKNDLKDIENLFLTEKELQDLRDYFYAFDVVE